MSGFNMNILKDFAEPMSEPTPEPEPFVHTFNPDARGASKPPKERNCLFCGNPLKEGERYVHDTSTTATKYSCKNEFSTTRQAVVNGLGQQYG